MTNRIGPCVSVIIATFNVEGYVSRAIESALDQNDLTKEVIVVDDASSDRTTNIVEQFGDQRVRLIKLEKNSGPGAVRNIGFKEAVAPWLAVLDGDDAFLPGRLKRCLTRAKIANANIIVDNLLIAPEETGENSAMFDEKTFGKQSIITLPAFIRGNSSLLGDQRSLGYLKPIFSTEFVRSNKLEYDPMVRIGEDYFLMCDALSKGGVCIVEPSIGYKYTVRKTSISHRLISQDVVDIAHAEARWLARTKLDGTSLRAQRIRQNGIHKAIAFAHLVEGLKAKRFRAVTKAFLDSPVASLNLWRPLAVRAQRLTKALHSVLFKPTKSRQ